MIVPSGDFLIPSCLLHSLVFCGKEELFPFFPIHLISMGSCLLFYAMICNPYIFTTIIYFNIQNVPDLASGHPFRVASLSFWHVLIILWACSYFCHHRIFHSSYTFPAPISELAISPRASRNWAENSILK